MKYLKLKAIRLGMGLLLAGAMAYFAQEAIRQYFLIPVEYVLWAIRIILETLPQVAWWGIILFVLLIIATRIIPLDLLPKSKSQQTKSYKLPGRIETWINRITKSSTSSNARWKLAHHLAELAIEIISEQERLSPRQVRDSLINGMPDIPPEIQAYLVAGLKTEPLDRSRGFSLFSNRQTIHPALAIDPQLVVDFLEKGYPDHDSKTP